MGATTNDKSQLLYLNKGRFNFRIDDKTWGSHEAWEGYIRNVTWKFIEGKDNRPGYEAINLHMDDGQEKAVITCRFDSGYGRGIAQTLFGADLNRPVKVSASYSEENGEKRGSFFMNQGGQSIKWAFTKDKPNGMPEAKVYEIPGKPPVIDRTEQLAWLKAKIQSEVLPKIPHALFLNMGAQPMAANSLPGSQAVQDVRAAMATKAAGPSMADDAIPDDDLPF
jgi:hypothetical protein